MARETDDDDALVDFEISVDSAPREGAFRRAQPMDAAPPPASMHHGQAPAPEVPKKRSKRGAGVPVPSLERSEPEEQVFDAAALRASARSAGRGPGLSVLVVIGLVVMTCSGVTLAGAALWFSSGEPVAEPGPEPEPELPTRTGSRGEIPVEQGLRRGAPVRQPEPERPEVPDPTE